MTEQDTTESVKREKVRFASGDTVCAAWHYPGTNGACVIMAGGRRGDQGAGHRPVREAIPRGRVRCPRLRLPAPRGERRAAAPGRAHQGAARRLAGRDRVRCRPCRESTRPGLAIWGFSLSGGQVFRVAARNPQLAAAIAQTPNADGPAAARNAARHQKPLAMLRLTGRGILDALGGLVGRPPRLVPLVGLPGTVALLTTPDGIDGDRALNPGNRYPDWQQAVAARSALATRASTGPAATRPGCGARCWSSSATRIRPRSPGPPSARRSERPGRELVRLPGGHYEPFLDGHEQAVEAELSFLRRHLLDHLASGSHGPPPRIPRRTEAGGHEADRAVRWDHRILRTPAATGPRLCSCTG